MSIFTLEVRDAIVRSALAHCENMSGKKQDLAIFDHLAGACAALYSVGMLDHPVPPFLFVIAVRGGDRFKECQRLLAESAPYERTPEETAAADEAVKGPK